LACVLVVDDDWAVTEFVTAVLGSEGHEIYGSSDGLQGAQVLRERHVDIAIIDLLMPERDGVELLKEIRAVYSAVKTIIISHAPEFLPLMTDLGADRVMAKPMSKETTKQAVNDLLP